MIPMATTGEEVSLYVHIPFCTKKCPYCHFYVLKEQEEAKELLLASLLLEWEKVFPLLKAKKLVSIYFGGGTPLLFAPERIQLFLSRIFSSGIALEPSLEITLEANPENVTASLMQRFKEAGINRVSLGVQSLSDTCLKVLGRTHTADKAKQAIQDTLDSGITNISIDLMIEVPHQTLTSWQQELEEVKNLPITHISLYNLTFEPQTPFFRQQAKLKPFVPPDTENLKLLETAIEAFEAAGLNRYEISAFAKSGYESKHNTGYWTARPFLGLGPSAFSYWEGKRYRNMANLPKYAKLLQEGKSPVDFEEGLELAAKQAELLAVELRLVQGVNLPDFQKKHGILPECFFENFETLSKKGWLETFKDQLRLTPEGLLFYDSVAAEII